MKIIKLKQTEIDTLTAVLDYVQTHQEIIKNDVLGLGDLQGVESQLTLLLERVGVRDGKCLA